jgi:hypothetical protein
LPDGIFAYQKIQFFKGLGMEISGLFFCHLVYSVVMWYLFSHFSHIVLRKLRLCTMQISAAKNALSPVDESLPSAFFLQT